MLILQPCSESVFMVTPSWRQRGAKSSGVFCLRGFTPASRTSLPPQSPCRGLCAGRSCGDGEWHFGDPKALLSLQPDPGLTGVPPATPQPSYLPGLHSDVGSCLVEDVVPPVEGEGLCRIVSHLQGAQEPPSAAGGGTGYEPSPARGCTHPRRAALDLHPDGLGDAVLPLPQPLPWQQGHQSLAAAAPPELPPVTGGCSRCETPGEGVRPRPSPAAAGRG